MSALGFVLQPTYRLQDGRAVIHLYGRLQNGEPFLVRDDRQVPHFYIRREDVEKARRLGAEKIESSTRHTLSGHSVARVDLKIPSDTPRLRRRLGLEQIPCYEADIRFAMRYLIDRHIRGAVQIEGSSRRQAGMGRIYENPHCRPAQWTPQLKALSVDIETDSKARRLLSLALHGCGISEVLLLRANEAANVSPARHFDNEKSLLDAFSARVQELDPDIITGWNVVDFDLFVLAGIAAQAGAKLALGRYGEALRLRPARSPWADHEAIITGRVVLDGIHLLRGSFIPMQEYSLDFVSRKVLGKHKTLHGPDRPEEILNRFENDLERFIEYNLTDAQLVLEILSKLKLVELAVERSLLTGLPIDRVSGSIAAFDFLYLGKLQGHGIVAPSVQSSSTATESPGGHVLEPVKGLHRNVLVFDFKSLYPSLIRTFEIDPLGYVSNPSDSEDLIRAPNGAAFRRERGILPGLLDDLFPRRDAAKAEGDQVTSHAIKILMNSFYGVLGTPACRFYNPQLASAITTFGREILLWSKSRIEQYGYQVLYGDTDSLFVLSGESDPGLARSAGKRLVARLNQDLSRFVQEKWKVQSRLELQMERLYRQLHLPSMRKGQGGARKRYVGLAGEGETQRLHFVGMEVVRRDWTELAKQVQRELYQRLFAGDRLEDYLAAKVSELRGGNLDDQLLVYRKAIRKPLVEYTATTPPHVAAARKLKDPPGRLISYLITTAGPEAVQQLEHPIDQEHYVQKQVRAVAEPILDLVGLKFDKVIGDDRQLELF